MTHNAEFWTRNPKKVAKDLVMSGIFDYRSMSYINSGVILEADAWDEAIRETDAELFSIAPGSMGAFSSRRGAIPVITSHANGKTGLITLRKIVMGEETLGPKAICERFGFGEVSGSKVGTTESGLYVVQNALPLPEGYNVVDSVPKGSPENRVAYFKLGRK
jgi:hypothetical protein